MSLAKSTDVGVVILLKNHVLKIGSAGEPVRLLVHDSTGPTGSITGRTVLPCKYKIIYALTKYIKFSE